MEFVLYAIIKSCSGTWEPATSAFGNLCLCFFSDSRKTPLWECPLSCGVMEDRTGGRDSCFVFCLCCTQLESSFILGGRDLGIWSLSFCNLKWKPQGREATRQSLPCLAEMEECRGSRMPSGPWAPAALLLCRQRLAVLCREGPALFLLCMTSAEFGGRKINKEHWYFLIPDRGQVVPPLGIGKISLLHLELSVELWSCKGSQLLPTHWGNRRKYYTPYIFTSVMSHRIDITILFFTRKKQKQIWVKTDWKIKYWELCCHREGS